MTNRCTITGVATARQEIRKSRFVATAGPIADVDAARAFIATHSDPTAGHNCWAWRIGHACRFNDDGEPGGTAGKPILTAIDGQGLDGVAVVVSRWFGGVLLGSGGLVRAYGGTAAICLREAEKVALVETVSATIASTFGDLALVQARLGSIPGAEIRDQAFTGTGASLTVSVPKDQAETIARLISNLTSGRSQLKLEE